MTTTRTNVDLARETATDRLADDVYQLARMIRDDARTMTDACRGTNANWANVGDLARVREALVEALVRMNGCEIADVECRVRAGVDAANDCTPAIRKRTAKRTA